MTFDQVWNTYMATYKDLYDMMLILKQITYKKWKQISKMIPGV